jgi:membrane protein required for colicin V production
MVIDIITVIFLAMALWKGYSRGFIVAIFSFLAILIGLAAAIKLSVIVTGWLSSSTNISKDWLPFISFAAVMIIVIILVRWIANILQKSIELAMLGWLNRLAGIVLYIALYMMVYSIILFYGTRMGLIKDIAIRTSVTYAVIEPWGPKVVDILGDIFPFFKNMFNDLENFFGKVAPQKSV